MDHPLVSSTQPNRTMNSSTSAEEWLEVGHVVGAHGLNGEVKIYPDSDFPERFTQPGLRWLRSSSQESSPREIQLIKGRCGHKGLYVVRFAGIQFRDQAEALKGWSVLVKSCDRPTLEAGEYYLSDLIGLAIVDHHTQSVIGKVVKIASAGNDLLEVQLLKEAHQTVLIPFVSALVPVVDIENQRIEILPLKGLLPT